MSVYESGQPTGQKRKRGRPRKNGMHSVAQFNRSFFAMEYYHEARRAGMKREVALREAADQQKCSVTEVKRSLARFQPVSCDQGFVTGEIRTLSEAEKQRNKNLGLPEFFWKNDLKVVPFGIGPIPKYSRHNARKKKK